MQRIYIDDEGNLYNKQGDEINAKEIGAPFVQSFRGYDPSQVIVGKTTEKDKINAYTMGCPLHSGSSNHFPVQFYQVL